MRALLAHDTAEMFSMKLHEVAIPSSCLHPAFPKWCLTVNTPKKGRHHGLPVPVVACRLVLVDHLRRRVHELR